MKKVLIYLCLSTIPQINFTNDPINNQIQFRGKQYSSSVLAELIYDEAFTSHFATKGSILTLAAVKCYENLDKKGVMLTPRVKSDLQEILEINDFWFTFMSTLERKAQAFYLMHCGHMIPVAMSETQYISTTRSSLK